MDKKLVPEISRISDFEGGQAVQIYCENADWQSRIYWWTQEYDESKGYNFNAEFPQTPPANALVFTPEETVNQVLYIGQTKVVPCECALMWVENENGFSKPFVANRPQIWNVSVKTFYPGETIAVYGKNLARASYRKRPLAVLRGEDGSVVELKNVHTPSYGFDKQEFTADYKVPENTPCGKYKLYVNTSYGADIAWSNPFDIEVKELNLISYFNTRWNRIVGEDIKMPKANVKAINANSLGVFYDMYEELQSAIDDMSNTGGGIITLSSGLFAISQTIIVKPGVVLLGAGKGATTICAFEGSDFTQDWSKAIYRHRMNKYHEGIVSIDWQKFMSPYPHDSLVQINSNAGIEGIGLKLGKAAMGVVFGNDTDTSVENAFVNNVLVDGSCLNVLEDRTDYGAYSCGILTINHNINTVIWDSEFKALVPICMLPDHNYDVKIVHNRFECLPRQMMEPYLASMKYSVIAQNDFVSGRRGPMFQSGLSHNWIYQNRSIDVARSENALETYMSEFGKGYASGRVVSADENSFTLEVCDEETHTIVSNSMHKLYALIIDGRGFGQIRTVTATDDKTFTIDEPWDVIPDKTSGITVVSAAVRNLLVDNNTTLSNSPTQFIYGSGIENVYAGHYIDFGDSIFLQAGLTIPDDNTNAGKPLIGVLAFNTISCCQLRCAGSGVIVKTENLDSVKENADPDGIYFRTRGIFGNSIYRNVFDGSKGHIYFKNQNIWMNSFYNAGVALSGGYNMVAKNHILDYDISVQLINDCEGNLFDRNTYTHEGVRFTGPGTPLGTDKDRKWA